MIFDEFVNGASDWNNHIYLLWLALEETKTGDVIEMGCGDGSTNQLHNYCKANNRKLYSFDWSKEWLDKFTHMESPDHKFMYIEKSWDIVKDICPNPSVILMDHSPGERRVVDIRSFCDMNGIQVIHDTQPRPTAANYGFEMIWEFFKYRVNLTAPMNRECNPPDNRTWASAVSNIYDVTKWKNIQYGEYKIK